jgi:hypothetical protein
MGIASNTKFMQTLDEKVYRELNVMAKSRGVSIQEFLRAIVIPYYIKYAEVLENPQIPRHRRHPNPEAQSVRAA